MHTVDLRMIGCTASSPAAAVTNMLRLRGQIASASGDSLRILVHDHYYLDLSAGPLSFTCGLDDRIHNLWIEGPGELQGINADEPTTPLIRVERQPGAFPHVQIMHLDLTSDGSGFDTLHGGSMVKLTDVVIRQTGKGVLDLDGWNDFDTASYGIRLNKVDVFACDNVAIVDGGGHGVMSNRWHGGQFFGRVWRCKGTGFKLQQCNGVDINATSESNLGYGIHARDCGIDRRRNGHRLGENGGPNRWNIWLENNNTRKPSNESTGHRFSQMKLENCARIELSGHSGALANQIRGDIASLLSCQFGEPFPHLDRAPTFTLHDIQAPTRTTANFHAVWPDNQYAPTWDAANHVMTWPAYSHNKAIARYTAWWRMFPTTLPPATYAYRVIVQDVDGAMVSYAERREDATPRQAPLCGGFAVFPVSGSINQIVTWTKEPVLITGMFSVEDQHSGISLQMIPFTTGMEDRHGNAPQSSQHRLKFHACDFWRLA
jgi:hypothetical protein